MGEQDNNSQADWNADAIELGVVFDIKIQVSNLIDIWKLEDAYWKLRSMRRELDSILTRKKKKLIDEFEQEHNIDNKLEKIEIDAAMISLTDTRREYLNDNNEDNKLKFYNALEDFYMRLCFVMKKHGLYFRESNDMGIAAFRR